MAISDRLRALLGGAKVKYTTAKHPVAYTAQEIAAAQHVPGRQLAKSVLIKTDQGPVLAVLSASYLIDLKKLKAILRAKSLTIGKEADIKERFPDIEVGAMSPFGNLYGVPVVADKELGTSEHIVFNGGSHTETIKLRYKDFAALAKPKAGAFSLAPAKPKKAPAKKKARAGRSSAKRAPSKAGSRKPAKRSKRR